jgi:hypothetical protein
MRADLDEREINHLMVASKSWGGAQMKTSIIQDSSSVKRIEERQSKRNLIEVYRGDIESRQLVDQLQMILIFTSAALKAPYPLEMLSYVANPYHI